MYLHTLIDIIIIILIGIEIWLIFSSIYGGKFDRKPTKKKPLIPEMIRLATREDLYTTGVYGNFIVYTLGNDKSRIFITTTNIFDIQRHRGHHPFSIFNVYMKYNGYSYDTGKTFDWFLLDRRKIESYPDDYPESSLRPSYVMFFSGIVPEGLLNADLSNFKIDIGIGIASRFSKIPVYN